VCVVERFSYEFVIFLCKFNIVICDVSIKGGC
jgi:hypothetical protein